MNLLITGAVPQKNTSRGLGLISEIMFGPSVGISATKIQLVAI